MAVLNSGTFAVPDVLETTTSDRTCACTTGYYGVSGINCAEHTACRDGISYETRAPTASTNRLCTAVSNACHERSPPLYQAGAAGLTSDRICRALTECLTSQYETEAAGPYSNRVCATLTACTGTATEETAPQFCTGSTTDYCADRVCSSDCTSNADCGGHGSCNLGTSTCECESGYTGSDCSDRENPCTWPAVVDCGTHGSCTSSTDMLSSTCTCSGGWSGNLCDRNPASVCESGADCSGHGSCTVASTGNSCACEGGYEGTTCATAPDACAWPTTVDCGDHGSCVDGNCNCADSYTVSASGECDISPGSFCAADADCSGHGTCDTSGATDVCVCSDGYSGNTCSTAPDLCEYPDTLNCGTHGDCNPADRTCVCTGGFSGTDCLTPRHDCVDADGDCSGHGTCTLDGTEGNRCDCTDGHSDLTCSTAPDACEWPTPVACGDHGDCNPADRTCVCTGGWTGADCLTPRHDCEADGDCSGHGACTVNSATGNRCDCTGGYSGNDCSSAPAADCSNIDCGDHGVCSALLGTCECGGGFTGTLCETAGTTPVVVSDTYGLTLATDFGSLSDADDMATFKMSVRNAMASVLGISAARIVIVSVSAGSTTVDFYIEERAAGASAATPTADQAVATLLASIQAAGSGASPLAAALEAEGHVYVAGTLAPASTMPPPPPPAPEPAPEPEEFDVPIIAPPSGAAHLIPALSAMVCAVVGALAL